MRTPKFKDGGVPKLINLPDGGHVEVRRFRNGYGVIVQAADANVGACPSTGRRVVEDFPHDDTAKGHETAYRLALAAAERLVASGVQR